MGSNNPHALKPQHVAIVMDGNGRWAQARDLPRVSGHEMGVTAVKSTVKACITHQIPILTLFAFSCENWQRPPAEVNFLMDLFFATLKDHLDELMENGVRLRFIGDRTAFSQEMQRLMKQAEKKSNTHETLQLNLAMNYSGRWDILQAATKIAKAVKTGVLEIEEIDETLFTHQLAPAELPPPDLFIRTSGELRLSNFMLWQLAYTELYFTPVCWPDFTPDVFAEALRAYAQRERRFGNIADTTQEGIVTC